MRPEQSACEERHDVAFHQRWHPNSLLRLAFIHDGDFGGGRT